MYLVQIFLIIFGSFVYVTKPQLYPQKNVPTNTETKLKEVDKGEVKMKHIDQDDVDKKHIIANVPQSPKNNPHQNIGINNTLLINTSNTQAINNTSHKSVHTNNNGNLTGNKILEEQTDDLTSGAVPRGIMVFVALGFLFILYVGIKTYRRKSQDKRRTIVRKYGVRARRSDVEMEPLPLSDDDDDETLFDLAASRGDNR